MNVNGVCHIVFCGRLEARFTGRAILYTTCPGLGLAEPDKSRLFSLLTVHSRPPFPFTFCFLPPVNSDGTAGAVFCPVGFGDEHAAADRTAFQVLISENLRFQRSVQRQDRPAEPLTADRERNRLRAGAGVPIVKDNAVAVLTTTALPAYQAGRLFPLRRCHAVKGTVRPAFQWRQVFIGVISHAFPPFCFPLPFSPKRFPAPFLRRVPELARSPQLRDNLSRSDLWTKCPEAGSLQCFPSRGIPFRTVILFSRCGSSMNYPKSTPKRPPAQYIRKVGNRLEKQPFPRSRNCDRMEETERKIRIMEGTI